MPLPFTRCIWTTCLLLLYAANARGEPTPRSDWSFVFAPTIAEPEGTTAVSADTAFTPEQGFGWETGFGALLAEAGTPMSEVSARFSVSVPPGNYAVTVTFGGGPSPTLTTVKAESRRLLGEAIATDASESATRTFVVNVRDAALPPPIPNAPSAAGVLLNPREFGSATWDAKLTLEFCGRPSAVSKLQLRRVDVPTFYLLGDSTVTDQPSEPAASWGQMITRFFKPSLAVANHAESGETLKSFFFEHRLSKMLMLLRPGDFVAIQFGHNDSKKQWPLTYAEARTTYRAYLLAYIAEVRLRGATPILITSPQRRTFDENGKITNSHGDYPAVVREIAAEQNILLVDLHRFSTAFYEALGPEKAPLAFNQSGQDITHHNNYGAYQLAKTVVQVIKTSGSPLAAHVVDEWRAYDPSHPDPVATFALAPSGPPITVKPRGD